MQDGNVVSTASTFSQTAAEFLKAATCNSHSNAESDGFMAALVDPGLDSAGYLLILKKLFAALSPIEHALADSGFLEMFPSVRLRICEAALKRDLAIFGVGPVSPGPVPLLSSLAATAGALYVIEGSANGGRVICRLLQTRLALTEETGLAYFSLQASTAGSRFSAFIRELNQRLEPADYPTAAAYATLVFRNFTQ